jgi:DNA-binding YbaB/EbfC family protein
VASDTNPPEDDLPIRPDAVSPAGSAARSPGGDEAPDLLGLTGFDPSAAGLDMGALLEQATKMQQQLAAAQQQAAESVVEGVAGGGVVKISVTGTMEFQSVTIDPAAVDPDDVEMLQDLVLAALHDAVSQVGELQQGSMGLGGLDLGDLLGG